MNYLAHLALAQNTAHSRIGNLLGDFRRGVDIDSLPAAVHKGLQNHYLVDATTDRHAGVRNLRRLVSPARRRFSGIIADIAFDYFLCHHWSRFMGQNFDDFAEDCYNQISEHMHDIPQPMQEAMQRMIHYDWLHAYHSLEGVARAIDRTSERLRFDNRLHGGVEELKLNHAAYEQVFLDLYPLLVHTVEQAALEH